MITNLMKRINAPCDLVTTVPRLQALRAERLTVARATPVVRSRAKPATKSSKTRNISKAAKLLSNLSPEQLKALAAQLKDSDSD